MTRRSARGARPLALVGLALAVACSPPLFEPCFALEVLHPSDRRAGWVFAAMLAVASALLARSRRPAVPKIALAVFALLTAELGVRVYVAQFTVWPREQLAAMGRSTYRDLMSYQPHPFLQFIGRPDRTLLGNDALAATSPFNADGFHGPDVARAKPAGVCRVVCLGASTTASGYPTVMQDWLNDAARREHGAHVEAFECVNLAHGFYNSCHSVVNFALNGLDFAPDYVVFHHGWNDEHAARNRAAYRGDHSHSLRAFAPAEFADWLPIRASVIYRAMRRLVLGKQNWTYLEAAVLQPTEPALGYDLEPALATFERNARSVVDLALARGIVPVLATLPHGTDPSLAFYATLPAMERFAATLRALAASYGDRVLLVDLDRELSGQNALFKDVGHLTADGIAQKAARIGAVIAAHRATTTR